jgi:GNAT superfamily N-acetyltransferase
MSVKSSYVIRELYPHEKPFLFEWADNLSWNPGLLDMDSYYNSDPHGFFLGLVDDRPVAMISGVKHGKDFGYIGFYIVNNPDDRRKGYGLAIFHHALKYLLSDNPDRNIGLSGVPEQQENYKKAGFRLYYSCTRYIAPGAKNDSEAANSKLQLFTPEASILSASQVDFNDLLAYDQIHFGYDRSSFLKEWINMKEMKAFVMNHNDGNGIIGFIGIRPSSKETYHVGPLFADNETIAEDLLCYIRSLVPSTLSILIDVPDINESAISLMNKYGFSVGCSLGKMYTKELPNIPLNHVYSETSAELG